MKTGINKVTKLLDFDVTNLLRFEWDLAARLQSFEHFPEYFSQLQILRSKLFSSSVQIKIEQPKSASESGICYSISIIVLEILGFRALHQMYLFFFESGKIGCSEPINYVKRILVTGKDHRALFFFHTVRCLEKNFRYTADIKRWNRRLTHSVLLRRRFCCRYYWHWYWYWAIFYVRKIILTCEPFFEIRCKKAYFHTFFQLLQPVEENDWNSWKYERYLF